MEVVAVLLACCCVTLIKAEVEFIDLSHVFGYKTLAWPENPPYNFSLAFRFELGQGIVSVSNKFQTAEHSGTHVDAPRHFCPKGKLVHELTLDQLHGPGVMLDFRTRAENADYQVSVQDVLDWEEDNGKVPYGAIVLLNFGWNQYWADYNAAFKSNNLKDFTSFHWPGLHIDAAKWLAKERHIKAIGTDCVSGDYGQSTTYPVHVAMLCDYEVLIIENVGNVDALPPQGSTVFIGAIKLENGSGVPIRLFATVSSGSAKSFNFNPYILVSLFSCIFGVLRL